jgi:hypothetical protein
MAHEKAIGIRARDRGLFLLPFAKKYGREEKSTTHQSKTLISSPVPRLACKAGAYFCPKSAVQTYGPQKILSLQKLTEAAGTL